jgi:hypothetical protein
MGRLVVMVTSFVGQLDQKWTLLGCVFAATPLEGEIQRLQIVLERRIPARSMSGSIAPGFRRRTTITSRWMGLGGCRKVRFLCFDEKLIRALPPSYAR